MKSKKVLNKIRLRRAARTRSKMFGTINKPRLSIFRSNRYTYGQLVDDEKRQTIVSASTQELSKKQSAKKQRQAELLGELIAEKSLQKGIKRAVFDRGSYKYHGRVKAVAEGARKKGLQL